VIEVGAWFILGFALYCVAEWFAASWLAAIIGWPGVLLVVGLGIIIGVAVMRRAGFAAARSLRPTQVDGVTVMPGGTQAAAEQVGREVGDASLVFVAGAMIALPGLITSALGLVLLIPPVRRLVRRSVSRSVRRRAEAAGAVFTVQSTTVTGTVVREDDLPPVRGELLQGEIVRDDDPA